MVNIKDINLNKIKNSLNKIYKYKLTDVIGYFKNSLTDPELYKRIIKNLNNKLYLKKIY